MKRILSVLLALMLVAAACGSSAEDATDSDDTGSTDDAAVDDGEDDADGGDGGDGGTSVETDDESPPDEDEDQPEDEQDGDTSEPDHCVTPADDQDSEPIESEVETSTKPVYAGDVAGVGEADPDLVDIATYDEGKAMVPASEGDVGGPVSERVRANPCVIFGDDDTVYQCIANGGINGEVEAYIRLDQYLVWTDAGLEVRTFGENEFATPEDLEAAIVEASREEGVLEAGPDYILFSNMGYGVFPADNPTSVGTYTIADANAGPNGRRDGGSGNAHIVIADTGYPRNAPPFGFLDAVTNSSTGIDIEDLPVKTSNPGTAHGLMVAGVAGQKADGTPITVLDVRDQAKKLPSPTDNGSEVELISIGSLKNRLFPENADEPEQAETTILNMSFGTYGCADDLFEEKYMEPFKEFVDNQLSEQYVLVASAGNNDVDEPQYPAAFDKVIGVGAIDDTVRGTECAPAWKTIAPTGCVINSTEKPWFSNYGSWIDVWAPGTDIVTAYPEGLTYEYRDYDESSMTSSVAYTADPGPLVRISGTSLAAPYVSALLANLGLNTAEINALVEADDFSQLGLATTPPTNAP